MSIIVTGGAGFIGSNLVKYLKTVTDLPIVVVDKLTYAGSKSNLTLNDITFYPVDICNHYEMLQVFDKHNPKYLFNLAAESHVDNSIDNASPFVTTNIVGAHILAEVTREYLKNNSNTDFKFIHISTDEIYGSLTPKQPAFTENSNLHPNSPYAATKAASDLLLLAYQRTYNLPIVITNCSNNYGPNQLPEKFIPLCILNALAGKDLPVYGDGQQIRDWLYVLDHAKALWLVAQNGKIGETYCIGGDNEIKNLTIVTLICELLQQLYPSNTAYKQLIKFVQDRPAHDRRYAIDASKIRQELNWQPETSFDDGIQNTIMWYLNNPQWVASIKNEIFTQRKGLKL